MKQSFFNPNGYEINGMVEDPARESHPLTGILLVVVLTPEYMYIIIGLNL